MAFVTGPEIDWAAADRLAAALGLHTRALVADRKAEPARDWCRRMASETARVSDFGPGGNTPRASSYIELAVLLGGDPEGDTEEAS